MDTHILTEWVDFFIFLYVKRERGVDHSAPVTHRSLTCLFACFVCFSPTDQVSLHTAYLWSGTVSLLVRPSSCGHPLLLPHPLLDDRHPLLSAHWKPAHLQQPHCCGPYCHLYTRYNTQAYYRECATSLPYFSLLLHSTFLTYLGFILRRHMWDKMLNLVSITILKSDI